MRIEKARELGFCSGVRRAIDLLEKAARQHGGMETLGALVHNRSVTESLTAQGIKAVQTLGDAKGKVIAISSHGVSPKVAQEMRARDLLIIDATCPRVRHAQRIAKEMSERGLFVVVFGEGDHPEVRGILGWAGGKGLAAIDAEAVQFPERKPARIGIISQTTRDRASFAEFCAACARRWLPSAIELRAVNTICQATAKRQAAAADLASRNDLILVVGGRSSSNTKRLAETCRSAGIETHLIEDASEIDPSWLIGNRGVGVTAGTSTPDWVIDGVVDRLKELAGAG